MRPIERFVSLVVLAMVAVTLVGCNGVPAAEVAAAQEVKSSHTRQTVPAVSENDRAKLVAGNTAFAWQLYDRLRVSDGNIFFSPYSISQALVMTYAGAQGATAQQMAKTMHFDVLPDQLHPAFNALDKELMTNAAKPVSKDEGVPFILKNANAIWGQHGYPWKPAFLDLLAEQYGAGLRVVDFQAAPGPARTTINDWVKQATAGKIVDLLPASAITPMTRMVLTNAIYFKADWLNHFQKEFTRPANWTLAGGKQLQVPMMSQQAHWLYAAGSGYQAIELRYYGGSAMDIVLSDRSNSSGSMLDATKVNQIIAALHDQEVILSMPKFDISTSSFSVMDVLQGLGMTDAFNSQTADFGGMADTHELFIGDVIHKATITVDEQGTEAAAASAVAMMAAGAPLAAKPVEMHIDHPFVFLIRDLHTNTILFMGRVANPQP